MSPWRRIRRVALGYVASGLAIVLVRSLAFSPSDALRAWLFIASRGHGGQR
jgi:hypothetical protein